MKKAIKELIESLPTIKYEDSEVVMDFGSEKSLVWSQRELKVSAFYDRDENCLMIEGGDSTYADYYGEFRGGYPWIHPELEKWAEERNLDLEWHDPGTLSVGVWAVAS
jgi:hypothetical protein